MTSAGMGPFLPYSMKIICRINLATLMRMVLRTELNFTSRFGIGTTLAKIL